MNNLGPAMLGWDFGIVVADFPIVNSLKKLKKESFIQVVRGSGDDRDASCFDTTKSERLWQQAAIVARRELLSWRNPPNSKCWPRTTCIATLAFADGNIYIRT